MIVFIICVFKFYLIFKSLKFNYFYLKIEGLLKNPNHNILSPLLEKNIPKIINPSVTHYITSCTKGWANVSKRVCNCCDWRVKRNAYLFDHRRSLLMHRCVCMCCWRVSCSVCKFMPIDAATLFQHSVWASTN